MLCELPQEYFGSTRENAPPQVIISIYPRGRNFELCAGAEHPRTAQNCKFLDFRIGSKDIPGDLLIEKEHPMDQAIQDFIAGKRIAVVGVSRSGKKFGNTISLELKQRGYQVFMVHPQAQEIGGERCYPNLASLQGKVDGVLICLPPTSAGQALREAAQAGMKKVWLQQGAQSPEVLALARELGITPVAGKCILMYVTTGDPFFSPHRLHGAVMKLIGQY